MLQKVTVTAAIIIKNGLVLCVRKAQGLANAGYWEFPGGKVEIGESFVDSLQRELLEELSLSITVKKFFHENTHRYPEQDVHLYSYLVEPNSDIQLGADHDDIKWLPVAELSTLNWSAADLPVVEKLMTRGIA